MGERAAGASKDRPRVGCLGVLAYITDEINGGLGFPSEARIAHYFGWRQSSVRDALMRLASDGKIRVVNRKPSGRGFAYTYEL